MALVIPPGFADVAIELRAVGDPTPWYCTYGVDISDAGGDIEAIGERQISAFSLLMPDLHPDVTLTGVKLTIGQDGPDPVRQFVPALTTINGATPGAKLPQNCALLVRKNTAAGGRRSRGRMFVPLILGEAGVSNVGVISPDALNDYATSVNDFFGGLTAPITAPGTPMVVLHSTGISAVPDPSVVTTLSCDNVISTQRRRLR